MLLCQLGEKSSIYHRPAKLINAPKNKNGSGKKCNPLFFLQKIREALGFSVFGAIPKAHKEYNAIRQRSTHLDPRELKIAKLHLADQYLAGATRGSITTDGILTLISPHGMGLLGWQPFISSGIPTIAGAALGGIFLLRGMILLGKTFYESSSLHAFETHFRNALSMIQQGTNVEQTVDKIIKKIEQLKVGVPSLQRKNENALQVTEFFSLKAKIKYLENIEEEIYKKKLSQKVSMVVGGMMIFGGLLALTVLFSGGTLALPLIPIIALISTIFSSFLGGVCGIYDSQSLSHFFFKKKYFYAPSEAIERIKILSSNEALKHLKEGKPRTGIRFSPKHTLRSHPLPVEPPSFTVKGYVSIDKRNSQAQGHEKTAC